MNELTSFIRFVLSIPSTVWNTVQANAGVYALIPVVMILLPLARRLWNKIIKY